MAAFSVPVVPPLGKLVGSVWLVIRVAPDHPGQLVAFGSVGNALLLVATISQYRFAPVTDDQLNVGVVYTPVTIRWLGR